MGQSIVILGGGTGGVAAANVLLKVLPKEHHIILIDRLAYHQFKANLPLVMVGQRKPDEILIPLSRLMEKGIEVVQAEVQTVDFVTQEVQTNLGSIPYDYLIISLGAESVLQSVTGFAEAAFNMLSFEHVTRFASLLPTLDQGRIVVFISHFPICGMAGPHELVLLLNEYMYRHGRHGKVRIKFVTPETYPLSIASPRLGRAMLKNMEKRGIQVITQAKVLRLDYRTGELILDGGINVPGEVFIGVPSYQGPSIFKDTPFSQDGGWLKAHPYTLATPIARVYAIGDAVGLRMPATGDWLPKLGIMAHYQGEVVARNIALEITGQAPRFRFTGKAVGIPFMTGFGKGRLFSLKAYRPSSPALTALPPSRLAYWFKVAFEKYWLNFWF